jgi:hypothetical protein
MSHRIDLSGYTSDSLSLPNVGWLDRTYAFPQGRTSQAFRDALAKHIRYSSVQTFGRHQCNLCNKKGHNVQIQLGDLGTISLGSCEILVFSANDLVYVAPDLVYHYVNECEYLPPEPFIEAVISSPCLPSDDYIACLTRLSATRPVCPLVEMISGKIIWMPSAFLQDHSSERSGEVNNR